MAGEFELIQWIVGQTQAKGAGEVIIPPGDDLAAVRWPAEELMLVGVDQVLDQVHFDLSTQAPGQIGAKLMNRNLSDCAAMACLPVCAVIAVTLPRGLSLSIAQELYKGVEQAGAKWGCQIVGGDTASWNGPLVMSLTVIGKSAGIAPVRRNGAKAGDYLYVTGPLGGSILGRHLTFEPRVQLARELAANYHISAMIDLSDGLSRDIGHICRLSEVGATIDAALVPIHTDADQLSQRDHLPAIFHALHDGEDYELLLTSPDPIDSALARRIGRMDAKPGIRIIDAGREVELVPMGWEHRL